MARPTSKVRLENGLRLDLYHLARHRYISLGAATGPVGIVWTSDYWGEIERGAISADMTSQRHGWLRIQTGNANQCIALEARPRHYGGEQWYFVCPATGRRASVLWRPPGSHRFFSRATWGRQVAYTSQCLGKTDRAWRTKTKIKRRLIADLDPDEWDFPPKPKWMRWRTYNRAEEQFDRYEAILDEGSLALVARFIGLEAN